ncbi:uncharacterized protein F4812DRAFT_271985 [Daldinia caldariorum]|uniref:uncharacterized protein n=1 Tax=Daldinia caldariorum TaxID=326644 RepID=UPI0020086B04|nr:uncharacterized protein F4812DRAFT_271985 [Daldinia caldariorum]KAI1470610.1 hypothetical protein F4812DRAFT_271985 [Daldinia caldariorum]
MSTLQRIRESRLYCPQHRLLTCKVCLHSVNIGNHGTLPMDTSGFPCAESAHSVDPRFELAQKVVADLGYVDGLHPDERYKQVNPEVPKFINDGHLYYDCEACGLTYAAGGGPGSFGAHPSHICSDGERYVIAVLRPKKFLRATEKIECQAHFNFGHESKMNISYQCVAKSDDGTIDWNLDNVEIAALTRLLHHVADVVVPYRRKFVDNYIYANSAYFAGQARRFQLLVVTPLKEPLLHFLGKVIGMKYSTKRKAYIERGKLGFVTKKYPATEERRYQISSFIRMIKHLAAEGIQVHWWPGQADSLRAARKYFLTEPYVVGMDHAPNVLSSEEVEPNDEVAEDDLVPGDSFWGLPDHHEFQAVQYAMTPDDDGPEQQAIRDSLDVSGEENSD